MIKCISLLLAIIFMSGCLFTDTIYVPNGKAVRLRKTIKKAPVWVLLDTGEKVATKMDLPNGWFCLPDPRKE